ncbi:MAG: SIMPL domain-containing protein [bacterium]
MKRPLLCILALTAVVPCWAQTGSDRGRIVAPGFAVAEVAPDSLSIDFELETTSDSFQQGAAKARSVAADLESIAPPLEGITLSVSHDLTFMQEKKWTSGTKQQHKFRLSVDGVPDGQAEKAMTAIVESALTKVANLTVTGFEARLSDSRTKRVQIILLKEAIADAREFASTAAAEANLKVQSVRALTIGGPDVSSRPYELGEEVAATSRYYGNVSKAFTVRDQLASKIHVSVKVVVEYDCEPK